MADFSSSDFKFVAEWVVEECSRRKRLRSDLNKQWDDIDRQVKMIPDVSFKYNKGRLVEELAWMPEVEPELQAQTLEVLTADARRLMFPDSGPWFSAHAVTTDKYLADLQEQSLVVGSEIDVPSKITQDNVDQMCAGAVSLWHRQYDFFKHIDLINAEVFKFGVGVGKARLVRKRMIAQNSKGIMAMEQKIPMLLPRSIRKTYLDDREVNVLHQGFSFGGSVIYEEIMNVIDLRAAANLGGTDPDDEDGGWMPSNTKGLEGDKHGDLRVLEWEGDMVVPRKTSKDIVMEQPIITVAVGSKKGGGEVPKVVRFRWNKLKGSAHIPFIYHPEDLITPYASSPLMKGRGLQASVTEALRRFLMAAVLNTQPPLKWDRSDMYLAAMGGPKVFPGAQWGSIDANVEPVEIGNPEAMLRAYLALREQYFSVTGVNLPRLGAQTVSHTTAFAKQAELARGEIRLLDYVKSANRGPLTQWVSTAYQLGRPQMRNTVYYVDAYGGHIKASASDLPEDVMWEVFGAGGPFEEQQKKANRTQALQLAISVEQLKAQQAQLKAAGLELNPKLDLDKVIEQVLSQGGWTDIDSIFVSRGTGLPPEAGGGQVLPVNPTQATTAPTAAIQSIAEQVG